jgi:LPS sulfotransferase NodH
VRFCIVGTGRCGSTLLQRMMNSHPELYVFPETHWIPKMYEWFGSSVARTELLLDIVRRTKHVNGTPAMEFSEQHLRAIADAPAEMSVSEFCDFLGEIFAREAGKRIWADKTPDYGWFMATLQSLWPDCKFIHLIRDGSAVVHSMSHHPGYRALVAANEINWSPLSFNNYYSVVAERELPLKAFVDLWYLRLMRTWDEAKRLRPGTYLEIRYETLVRDPVAVLESIRAFLALDAAPSWIEQATDLIDPRRFGNGRSSNMLQFFDERHMQTMKMLGYSTSP